MNLSIAQAAAALGKSDRQVRYLIRMGRLPAMKVDGAYVIQTEDLPLSPGQLAAREQKVQQLRDVVEDALGLNAPLRRRYSLRDLRAFKVGAPLLLRTRATLGEQHAAVLALRQCLRHLALGCHRFERRDKSAAYRMARDAASEAALELALSESPEANGLLDLVEQELLATIAGLMRRSERGEQP